MNSPNVKKFVLQHAISNYDHIQEMAADDLDHGGTTDIPELVDFEQGVVEAVRFAVNYALANMDDLEDMREEDLADTGKTNIPMRRDIERYRSLLETDEYMMKLLDKYRRDTTR